MASVAGVFAPVPDFRYVGLEPVMTPGVGAAVTACGLGAGVTGLTLASSGLDAKQALVAGALASFLSAVALKGATTGAIGPTPSGNSARMAIVPWGVLVETAEAPRILRWAAVRKIEVETSTRRLLRSWGSGLSSRVAIETQRDRFVGEAVGVVALGSLVDHLGAYAAEQSTPLALELVAPYDAPHDAPNDQPDDEEPRAVLETTEPVCEPLIARAKDWLAAAPAVVHLDLAPAGYRRTTALAPTPRAVSTLRQILRDRRSKPADPRAFAAVVAAEIRATELVPELVALSQSPHPIVAAVARQAARKLGASRAKTGTVEEIGPFLFEVDRTHLEAWT